MQPTTSWGVISACLAALLFVRVLTTVGKCLSIKIVASLGIALAITLTTLIISGLISNPITTLILAVLLITAAGIPAHCFAFLDKTTAQRCKKIEKRLMQEQEHRRTCEEKWRKLFEGSESSILLLDTSLQIKEANTSIKRHLNQTHTSIVNSNFKDLVDLPFGRKSGQLETLALEEQLNNFLTNKRPVVLTLPLKNNSGEDPRSFRITLEFLKQSAEMEILATLSPINADTLTGYLIKEHQEHKIDNKIITVDEVCKRLTRNLIRYTTALTRNQILLGLREIVLNAMEHGNLEIGFQKKTEALENRNYMLLLNNQQKDPQFRRRKIHIEYSLEPEKVEYIVRDEGKGFDHHFFEKQQHQKKGSLALHGRGIMMTKNIFDTVVYSKKGSEVRLMKKL